MHMRHYEVFNCFDEHSIKEVQNEWTYRPANYSSDIIESNKRQISKSNISITAVIFEK